MEKKTGRKLIIDKMTELGGGDNKLGCGGASSSQRGGRSEKKVGNWN